MPQAAADLKCPHCGAKVGQAWKTCWLCGLELPQNLDESAPAATLATSAGSERVRASTAIAAGVGVFLLVCLGMIFFSLIANHQIGAAIMLAVLLLPAGLVTLGKSMHRRAAGVDLTGLDKLMTFLVSVAVTLGAIVALGVAAFVALFVVCIATLSGGGNLFR